MSLFLDDVAQRTLSCSRVFFSQIVWCQWWTNCWFQIFFYFHHYLGKISILTNIFQMGWNHHLVDVDGQWWTMGWHSKTIWEAWILQGSEIWAPTNHQKQTWGLKFDTLGGSRYASIYLCICLHITSSVRPLKKSKEYHLRRFTWLCNLPMTWDVWTPDRIYQLNRCFKHHLHRFSVTQMVGRKRCIEGKLWPSSLKKIPRV